MFAKYQRARRVVRKIVLATQNLNNEGKQVEEYLKPLSDRRIPRLLETAVRGPYSLDFECLYKCLRDPLGLGTFQEVVMAYHSGDYDTSMNLGLEVTEFYDNIVNLSLIMPPVIAWLQMVMH